MKSWLMQRQASRVERKFGGVESKPSEVKLQQVTTRSSAKPIGAMKREEEMARSSELCVEPMKRNTAKQA